MNELVYSEVKTSNTLLAPYIHSYLQVSGTKAIPAKYILPRAGASISFDAAGRYYNETNLFTTALSGLQHQPYIIHAKGDTTDCFAIRFTAYGLSRFTKTPVGHFTDVIINAASVWQDLNVLYERIMATGDLEKRISMAEDFFIKKLMPPTGIDKQLFQIIDAIKNGADNSITDALIAAVPLGMRQLQRRFKQLTGTYIKSFSRICRFELAVKLLPDNDSLTKLAYDANYFDQAHFSNEFKKLSGVRPTRLTACATGRLA